MTAYARRNVAALMAAPLYFPYTLKWKQGDLISGMLGAVNDPCCAMSVRLKVCLESR